MSIVGNRPLPLYEAERLTTDEWAERFLAPAGITGLWQIRKKRKIAMSIEERIHLDIDYANKRNFAYDLWILANTPTALFQKDRKEYSPASLNTIS
jgi:lipopolysaccharide/colanic/teichoic acid biosynthesis glycosyltransferase